VKTTRYFEVQVLRKRPYIEREWIDSILASPLRRADQTDGRRRHWGVVRDPRDGKTRTPRVVTLEDGETVHNAFFDRDFRLQDP
jgi:hypothetical protein